MNKTRMGKRVASILLSLVMMLSLLPTAAYAVMADGVDTQGAIVSENGTGVSDDSNSSGNTDDLQVGDSEGGGNTGDQQVGGSSGSGTADDTTGAEGGADPTDSVNGNDSADPQDDGDAVLPTATTVAKVGGIEYDTLADAIAALSSSSYTLELLDNTAWDAATPVYWAADAQSGYAATLADALTAAYKTSADAITIVCRPGADVGELTHGHVADDITIYGNNAYISSGECDLEVDTYTFSRETGKQVTSGGAYLEKDITVTAYELDNLGVWGQRHTNYKVTVNLTDCDSTNGITVQRVYISGTTGVNDITLTGCDFGTKATSVYSNADGNVVIDNCSFTGAQVPVNFNHKANGTQTVTVQNSTFANCGDNGDWKQFAAPVRFVNSGSGTMTTSVNTCTFTDTVGGNGDILLGDGREGEKSNNVELTVENTAANVQAQQPGYYAKDGTTDANKLGTKNVADSDKLTTSVTQLMPSSELTNYVTVSGIKGFDDTKFATFADAYAAIKPVVATLGLGEETPADAAAFDAVFTDISNGKATLTYTITGNVTYDETGLDHLLTMGRKSSHYLTNERHLINFKFVGAEADRGATLTVNSDITLPYEWWGEKITTSISFENLTITGSAPSGLFANQSFFEGIDFKVNNCTLKGIKIYNCANVGGSYTITNSKLDGTGAAKDAYAIHLQGNDTAPLNILIQDNQISGYDRGVNIDQKTAIATISGNSISINDSDRSCIQLTQLAKTTVSGNTMTLSGGNAITLHGNLAAGSKIDVIGNTITGTGHLIYDAAKGTIDLTYTDNTVSDTIDTTKGVYGGKEYEVSENVANALKPETTTYVAEVKGVKYETLQAAIDAAAQNATVTLLADTRENVTINTRGLTLDLNGHTLNGGTVAGKPALTVTNRVTVKDSSEEQTGTIMREDTAENSGVSSHYVIDIQDGWLFFESGSVTNNSGVVGVKGASLVRVGDDSVAKYPGLTISGGTFTQDNFIVIKVDRGTFYLKEDGTLNSKNSYAVENWKFAEIKGGTVNGAVAAWTYSGGHNSDLTISGGTVNGDVTSVNYGSAEGKVAKVSITGGTVNGKLDTRSYDPSTNELTSIEDPAKATIAVTGGTFKEDPSKYVVEDSAITPNDDGTYGVAKAYLAKVGDTSYYTMDEAFKAQTDSRKAIVMLRDYTTGSTFNSGSINRTVDLNGHTWTCTGTDANSAAFEINYPDASLTVKNGKVVSSQLVGLIPSAMGGTIKYDNSSLVFDGVEMTTTARSGIETNGNNTNDTVTLRNSTLNVPNGFGIYFPSSGTLTIDNSKINAQTMGVQVCSGSLNISGADTAITVSGDGIDKTINDGAIEDGAAISIVNRTGYKGLDEIKVEGGTFTAKGDNAAVKAYSWENQTASAFDNSKNVVAISGGTFSSAVDKSLCAGGYIPTQNADGTYGVKEGKFVAEIGSQGYESLQAAIDAAQDGQTVTLLADATEDVVISKSITLDLGGKTLTNTNVGKATISVQSGTVTVQNGSVVGGTSYYNIEVKKDANLTLTDVTATAGNTGSSMIDNYGTLTITSGTYTGGMNTVKSEEGSVLNISGGTFTCDFGKKWSYTAVILVYGTTTITGGEFIQKTTNTSSYAKVVMTGKVDGYEAFTKVTGGTFTNEKLSGIFYGLGDATADNFEVSGGTFNKYVSDSYMAEGFIPVKNANGTYGVKEGKFVAEVGSTGYETFDEAIAAANASAKSATIYLRENITIDHQLVIENAKGKTITLNLEGFTLTSTYAINKAIKNGSYALVNNTPLTIKNGTFAAGQARAIGALATLTLNEATVTQQLTGGHACVAFCAADKSYTIKDSTIVGAYSVCSFANNATITITGSTLTGTGHTLYHNGSNYGLKLTVKDTTITSSGGCGVYISGSTSAQSNAGNQNGAGGYQQATFTGCTISGALNGVEVKYTDLTLDGCTVSATAKDASYKQDNNGPAGSGFAVVSTDNAMNNVTPKPEGTIIIKGTGKYTGPVGLGSLKSVKETYADFADETIKISGGTFTTEVPAAYCADGFIPTQNEDGTYGVKEGKFVAEVGSTKYETLAEAIAAAQEGKTVTLLADVADCGSLTISKNITLDGGGHTISGNSSISVNMPGNAAADVTIKNVNFKDIANGNKLSAFYFSQVKGKLTITGCTFDSIEYEAIQVTPMEGAEVNVSNNVFKAKADGTQVRHIHIEMAYGSGFDCEGQNIKLTVTDNQLHGTVSGDASMGIWWVGTDSTLKVDGNYMEHPETVSITLSNGGVHYNRGDLIYPARSQADADVDDLIPAVIVADKASGESKIKAYSTLADAVAAAQDGQTVKLLADVEQNTQLTIDKSITLDLNGKTIRNTADIWGKNANAILSITNGAKVTITGNGTIDAKENDCYTINVVKGDLTIENGTFYGNVSVVQLQEGSLSVKGGTFDLHQKWEGSSKYLFNCIDEAYVDGSAKVAISGGTFVGFDPNVSPEQKVDDKTPSFAAPGAGITRNEDGSFTAAAGMTAQILDKDGNSVKAYRTLAEAVAAAEDGQTVRLLADVAESSIKVNANITIDLNKMTVTGSFVTYGEVTIQNGTIDVPDGKTNYAYGKLTLADVDITGKAASSSLLSVNYNGSVTIDKDSTIVADSAKGDYPAVFIKGQNDSGKTYAPELNIYGTVQSAKTPAVQGNGTDRGVSHVNVFEGAVVKSESLAVYLPQPCEVNITGGLVEGYCGIGIKSGTLNISGGTVRGVANDNVIGDEYSQTNGISYDGSAIMIDSYIGYAGQVQINISGNAVVESKYSTAIREIGNDKSQTNLVGLDITGGTVLGAKDTDAVLVRDVTAKDVNISGGEFSSIVKKEYCAPGFTPVTTANSEGRYGVEIGKFTVKVTSRTTGSDSPVANVAGGGSNITYAQGTTVTASAISGYKFVGWFVNEYTGTPYSTDLTCEVKPTADCTMIAVYEPISGGKFWLTVTASEFTVNGGAVQDSYLYEQFAVGASVTVSFTGTENFLYWVNASNKVVSTDKSYTFIMGSETTLKAVYGKARQNQATVVFISHSDQIISSKAYTTSDTIQFPVPPIKMGCTFTGWSMTESQIRAAMANNSGIIQVRALYTEPSIACKVTVIYPDGIGNEVVNAVVGKAVNVTAKDIEGKTFSYWTDNAGNVLGYTKTLKLAPSGDMTVKAVYDETAEAKPVITISEVSATKANESYVVTFMATRAVPDGYKVVKQGILWSRDPVCGEDGAAAHMQFDSNGKLPTGVNAYIGNNLDLNGVTRFDITTKYNDRTFYGRGYMVLESDAGELLYIYTDTIASGSYDSLTK